MRSQLFSSVAILAVTLAAASCSKGTEGPVATSITVTPPGSLTFSSVNQTVKLSAKVLDQHGDSMPGQAITWTSSNVVAATVNGTGLVKSLANGSSTITVSVGTLHKDIACSVAQVAAAISKVAGDNQVFIVGSVLPVPLDVRVTDALGSPVAGASVGFVISLGTGSLSTASAASNASGDATANWTLGTTAGTQQVTVSSAGLSSVTFAATANPGAANGIAIAGGNNQTFVPSGTLAVAPSARVTDQYGNTVSGAQVVFSVTSAGGGSVTGATQNTNASGIATVGSWTLGSAGTNTLQAALSAATATVAFTATAVTPGVPATVAIVAGNSQTGLVGYPLNFRPAVKVTDSTGLPVNNAAVTFAVTGGGGSVTGDSLNTNTNGIAQMGGWTIGASPGANTLTATVPGSGITGNPASFTATGASPTFNIVLQNVGPPLSPEAQSAFDSVVAKWQRIIYMDIPDFPGFTAAAGTCGSGSPAIGPVNVDDVMILVRLDSIDGPGLILGSANPCWIRGGSFQTILGQMRFDTADVRGLISSGLLNSVILHEMGHVLGFGSLWGPSYDNCLQNPSSTGNLVDTYFSCPKARAAFDSIGGTTYTGGNKVPVENCVGISQPCGASTFNGHWRELTFFNELMTGYLNGGTANPLSVMSIAAMEDLSYIVNYAAADPYPRTFSSAPAVRAASTQLLNLGDDIGHFPIYVVVPGGRVVRVIQPQ